MVQWIDLLVEYSDSIFQGWYTKILVAIIILLIGFAIARFLGRLTHRLIKEIELSKIIHKTTRIHINIEKGLSVFITYFIYFITIIMSLNQLNITTTVLSMLSGAVIIIIIIAIALAIKDFIPNMFAGFYIYKNNFLSVGERIKVKGIEGIIEELSLVETKLKTKEGDIVFIPNAIMTQTEVIKITKKEKKKQKK